VGVWIGARLVVTDPVSFVSPVLISCFLVQTTPFGCFSPKISHFRIVVSKVLTIFSSDLNCISKLLRQYCLTDFNDWNNYSNFLFYVILFFWYIRDKRYSFMSCICILIFCYSAPSIPKYWYYSVFKWQAINQRRLSGSVRNA
jgi:hypothetical protein